MISLIIFDKILSCTKCLSEQLQSVSIDLASAAELVLACKATSQQYRSDEMWDKVFKYTGEVAKLYDIETTCTSHSLQEESNHLDILMALCCTSLLVVEKN